MDFSLQEGQLQVLAQFSQILGQALDLDRALAAFLKVLSRNLALRKGGVVLREGGGVLRLAASLGFAPQERERENGPFQAAALNLVWRTPRPFVVLRGRLEPRFPDQTQPLPAKGEVSFMGAPILSGGSPLGVLCVDRIFGDEVPVAQDLQFLEFAAGIMAQVMSLNRQVRRREEGLRQEILSLRRQLAENIRLLKLVGESSGTRRKRGEQGFLSRLKEMEKREILAALERNRWIQSQAAMDLGLTLRQMGYRVKQFGLEKVVKEHRRSRA